MIYDSVIHIYNNNHGIENHLITELLNLKSKITSGLSLLFQIQRKHRTERFR